LRQRALRALVPIPIGIAAVAADASQLALDGLRHIRLRGGGIERGQVDVLFWCGRGLSNWCRARGDTLALGVGRLLLSRLLGSLGIEARLLGDLRIDFRLGLDLLLGAAG